MSILTAVRDMDRFRQITQVLMRHGFGELVTRMGLAGTGSSDKTKIPRPQVGERIRMVLQELGPTFVKLGQIMSTRGDLIPEDVLSELKKLQDDVGPFSAEEARTQIEFSLGGPVESIFATFHAEPIASASVAQVHRATLIPTDQDSPIEVAVKIQRPGIIDIVQRDLDLLYILARLIEKTIPESRVYSPTGLVREFDQSISAELDFTLEASNAKRFIHNFKDDETIHFPRIFPEASGKRVLTLEFLDGVKLNQAVEAGASREWIAETAVRLILKMVFEDGFFHADPHPGNVLILPRPEEGHYPPEQKIVIGLLDLGLVGRLSPELRDQSVDLLLAASRQDPDSIAEALLSIGHPRTKVDFDAFREHVRRISERHLGKPLREVDASAIIRDVIGGAMKFEIEIPTELTMMLRAIMTIEGVGKEIHPELDLLAVARPYLTKMVWQRFHPMKLSNDLFKNAGRLSTMARDLPFQMQDILEDLRQGRLCVQTKNDEAITATEQLGKRLRSTGIFATLLCAGIALLIAGKQLPLAWSMMSGAAIWIGLHLFRDLFHAKKNRR